MFIIFVLLNQISIFWIVFIKNRDIKVHGVVLPGADLFHAGGLKDRRK